MDRKRRTRVNNSKTLNNHAIKQVGLSQQFLQSHTPTDQPQQAMQDEEPSSDENSDLSSKIQSRRLTNVVTASKDVQFQLKTVRKHSSLKLANNKKQQQNTKQVQGSSKNILCQLQTNSTQAKSELSSSELNFDRIQENSVKSFPKLKHSNNREQFQQNTEKQLTFQYFFQEIDHSDTRQPPAKIKRNTFIPYNRSNISDQYEILEKVGEGAFGNVFKCQHKLTNSIRSVKIIKHQKLSQKHNRQLLKREIDVLKKLDHPSIIKIYEVFQYLKVIYIVCEFCAGGTLKSYLTPRFKLSLQAKKVIMQKIFQGISYMHKMGVIHRDLKPENILLVNRIDSDSPVEKIDIRIIDFGLSIQYKEKHFKDWAKIGSTAYMAPEVFQGIYSTKTDSWSCGVIMHLLFLSSNPFLQSEDFLILQKIHSYNLEDHPKWSTLQNSLKQILSSLLHLNYVLRAELGSIVKERDMRPRSLKKHYSNHRKVVEKLKDFKRGKNLIDFMRYYLSFNNLSQQRIKEFGEYFCQLDGDKNGLISEQQLRSYLQSQLKMDEKAAHKIFKTMNFDSSGNISFGEFVCALASIKELFTIQGISQIFNKIDISKDGVIDGFEFEHFLGSLSKSGKSLAEQICGKRTARISSDQFRWYVVDSVYLQNQCFD